MNNCRKKLFEQIKLTIEKHDSNYLDQAIASTFLKKNIGERIFNIIKRLLERSTRIRVVLLESILKIRSIPCDVNLLHAYSEQFELIKTASNIWKYSLTEVEIAEEKSKLINLKLDEMVKKKFAQQQDEKYLKYMQSKEFIQEIDGVKLKKTLLQDFLSFMRKKCPQIMKKHRLRSTGNKDELKENVQKLSLVLQDKYPWK